MASNGKADRQAAPEEEEIVLEMPVKPAAPPPPVKVSPAGAGASAWETAALPLSMVVVQAFMVVMLLLSKLALNTGMRPCVLIVYRNLVATAAVAPLAFFFERYGCAYPLDLPAKVPVFLFFWLREYIAFFLTKREYIALNNLFILSCKLKILVMHCVLLLVSSLISFFFT
jgi:hypothetical protein